VLFRSVSKEGQAIAHRFSSRAEVDEQYARYLKWGESSLSSGAYEALLNGHYDVMVSESYGWWTLMIAVPKALGMKARLASFTDAGGYEDQGVEVQEFKKRLVVTISCQFEDDGVNFVENHDSNPDEALVDLLVKIRAELIEGNTSFLQAVARFYEAFEDEEDEDEEESGDDRGVKSSATSYEGMSKAQLQKEFESWGLPYRKSSTKATLLKLLIAATTAPRKAKPKVRKLKLSRAARTIVAQLESR
jgi:hypothetical protein